MLHVSLLCFILDLGTNLLVGENNFVLRGDGPSYVVSDSLMFSYQVLWLSFGFIPIITTIPESHGKSDTVDCWIEGECARSPVLFHGRPAFGHKYEERLVSSSWRASKTTVTSSRGKSSRVRLGVEVAEVQQFQVSRQLLEINVFPALHRLFSACFQLAPSSWLSGHFLTHNLFRHQHLWNCTGPTQRFFFFRFTQHKFRSRMAPTNCGETFKECCRSFVQRGPARTPHGNFSFIAHMFRCWSLCWGPGESPQRNFTKHLREHLRFRLADFHRWCPLSFVGANLFHDSKLWLSSTASSSESWANVTQQICIPFTTHRDVP